MNPGIESLKGFLYQLKVFFSNVIDSIKICDVIFEGKDDVECERKEDNLFSQKLSNEVIQVKNGKIDTNTMNKILANWLNLGMPKQTKYVLFVSKSYKFEDKKVIAEKFVENLIEKNCKSEKKLQSNNILKKVYDHYFNGDLLNVTALMADLEFIIDSMILNCIVKNNDDLENEIFEKYAAEYCKGMNSQIAKEKRLCQLLLLLSSQVFNSIEKGEPYKVDFPEFFRINSIAAENVTDEKYSPSLETFLSKQYTTDMKESIFADRKVEVRQMIIAKQSEPEIIKFLGYELFYREIRDFNSQNRIDEVNEFETAAYDSYLLEKEEELPPNKLFRNTLKNEIRHDKIKLNGFGNMGCYIHLSSEEGDVKKRIKWGDENEK